MLTAEKNTETTIGMPAGIHPGLPFDQYAKIDAMNHSTLAWGHKSMRHLRAAMDGKLEREDTDALAFGRALHVRLLEPELYESRHPISPDFGDMRSPKNRKSRDDWEKALPKGCEPISESDAKAIEQCVLAVKEHPAEFLRSAKGQFETTVIGELCGVRFKARIDKLIVAPLTIVDVKKVNGSTSPSTRSGGDVAEFERRIQTYGYGMQAASQSDLVSQHFGGQTPRYFWIVIEDDFPHCAGVYRASAQLLAAGRNEYTNLLMQMKSCEASGKWPGFTSDVVEIDGPAWWLKQNEGIGA